MEINSYQQIWTKQTKMYQNKTKIERARVRGIFHHSFSVILFRSRSFSFIFVHSRSCLLIFAHSRSSSFVFSFSLILAHSCSSSLILANGRADFFAEFLMEMLPLAHSRSFSLILAHSRSSDFASFRETLTALPKFHRIDVSCRNCTTFDANYCFLNVSLNFECDLGIFYEQLWFDECFWHLSWWKPANPHFLVCRLAFSDMGWHFAQVFERGVAFHVHFQTRVNTLCMCSNAGLCFVCVSRRQFAFRVRFRMRVCVFCFSYWGEAFRLHFEGRLDAQSRFACFFRRGFVFLVLSWTRAHLRRMFSDVGSLFPCVFRCGLVFCLRFLICLWWYGFPYQPAFVFALKYMQFESLGFQLFQYVLVFWVRLCFNYWFEHCGLMFYLFSRQLIKKAPGYSKAGFCCHIWEIFSIEFKSQYCCVCTWLNDVIVFWTEKVGATHA